MSKERELYRREAEMLSAAIKEAADAQQAREEARRVELEAARRAGAERE